MSPSAGNMRHLFPCSGPMQKLSLLIRERRKKRGSIDFDFPESKILLDEKGRPVEINPMTGNAATRLIEDFMLMANETVAEDFYWQGQPFVYRTHENPDPEKIRELSVLVSHFGYHIRMGLGGNPSQGNSEASGQYPRIRRRKH